MSDCSQRVFLFKSKKYRKGEDKERDGMRRGEEGEG